MDGFEAKIRNPKDFSDSLLRLKNNKTFCDAEIVVGTKRFAVHSIVLAASSKYFEDEFNQIESPKKELFFKDYNPDIVQLLIEYCYTGSLRVTDQNIKETIDMANTFKLTPIVEELVKTYEKMLNSSNCLSIWKLAKTGSIENLKNVAIDYARKNFKEVSESSEFLELSDSEILQLLNADLAVKSETDVFNSVKKWVKHDENSRKKHLDRLSDYVNFEYLPKNVLYDESYALCSRNSSKECHGKISDALQQKDKKDFKSVEKDYRDSYNTVLVVGSSIMNKTKTMQMYDLKNEVWRKIKKFECNKALFSAVLLENKMLLIGGHRSSINLNSVECYNFETGTMEHLPSMKHARRRLSAVVFKGCVYALGGRDDHNHLSSMEMWDPVEKNWKELAPMLGPRSGCEAVVFGEEIFVLGGYGEGNDYLSSTESYNPITNTWKKRATMNEKRFGCGVTVMNGCIYVAGGLKSEGTHLSSVEKYDPKIDKWTMIEPLNTVRSWMGSGNLMGKFVIVGGFSYSDEKLSTMEMYDEENNDWITMQSLREPQAILRMVEVPWRLAKAVLLRED